MLKNILLTVITLTGTFYLNAQSSADCDVKSSYAFTGNVVMDANTSIDGGDPIPMTMEMLLDKDARYMGVSIKNEMINNMFTVVDLKDSNVIVLMELGGSKRGMCMDMNTEAFKKQMANQPKTPEYSKFTKIDEPRTILGHRCECYTYSDKDRNIKMWIADDMENVFKNYPSNVGGSSGFDMPEGMKGMFMAIHMDDKTKRTHVEMEITEISETSSSTISTEGYKFE